MSKMTQLGISGFLPLFLLEAFQQGGADGSACFSLIDLLGEIQHGMSHKDVRNYLSHYNHSNHHLVLRTVKDTIEGFPAIFYVIITNNNSNI